LREQMNAMADGDANGQEGKEQQDDTGNVWFAVIEHGTTEWQANHRIPEMRRIQRFQQKQGDAVARAFASWGGFYETSKNASTTPTLLKAFADANRLPDSSSKMSKKEAEQSLLHVQAAQEGFRNISAGTNDVRAKAGSDSTGRPDPPSETATKGSKERSPSSSSKAARSTKRKAGPPASATEETPISESAEEEALESLKTSDLPTASPQLEAADSASSGTLSADTSPNASTSQTEGVPLKVSAEENQPSGDLAEKPQLNAVQPSTSAPEEQMQTSKPDIPVEAAPSAPSDNITTEAPTRDETRAVEQETPSLRNKFMGWFTGGTRS